MVVVVEVVALLARARRRGRTGAFQNVSLMKIYRCSKGLTIVL